MAYRVKCIVRGIDQHSYVKTGASSIFLKVLQIRSKKKATSATLRACLRMRTPCRADTGVKTFNIA